MMKEFVSMHRWKLAWIALYLSILTASFIGHQLNNFYCGVIGFACFSDVLNLIAFYVLYRRVGNAMMKAAAAACQAD